MRKDLTQQEYNTLRSRRVLKDKGDEYTPDGYMAIKVWNEEAKQVWEIVIKPNHIKAS